MVTRSFQGARAITWRHSLSGFEVWAAAAGINGCVLTVDNDHVKAGLGENLAVTVLPVGSMRQKFFSASRRFLAVFV